MEPSGNFQNISRRHCPFDSFQGEVFISLVDYRNNLFISRDPKKISDFYGSFMSREELIQWMKERPPGATYIHTVEGDKNVIVIIPTAAFEGKLAKNSRTNIFDGLTMVFVESGELPDPYFRGSHNVNLGFKEALKYNPEWIIYSGDDMIKRDDIDVLLNQLKGIDSRNVDMVFVHPTGYHSVKGFLGTPNFIHKFITKTLKGCKRQFYALVERFCGGNQYWPLAGKNKKEKKIAKLLFHEIGEVIWSIDFGVLSGKFVKEMNGEVFDETYVSSEEDADLSLRIAYSGRYATVDYEIDEHISASWGKWECKNLMSVAGITYLSYKIEKGLLPSLGHQRNERNR